eukprot:m.51411 g.51411  ORF g.51411 m.51411 type:complete len:66 (-) comp10733_c0_seq1:1528-1725(-)
MVALHSSEVCSSVSLAQSFAGFPYFTIHSLRERQSLTFSRRNSQEELILVQFLLHFPSIYIEWTL